MWAGAAWGRELYAYLRLYEKTEQTQSQYQNAGTCAAGN